jgi:signal transduction histidine kinase/ABC-type nitrate/sulfonate/bicarbonate transport system substrate-binding protein
MKILLFLLLSFITLLGQNLQTIKLQLQWKHQFEFAGFYTALEKGYYKEVGLDVEFLEYNSKTNIIESVLNKKADMGLTYSSLISEYLNHKPVVFVANYFKQSPLIFVTQENIVTPFDLKGKIVMGGSDPIDHIALEFMLKKFDLDKNDITLVEPTFNINDFTQKKVDAMLVFKTNELYKLNKMNYKFNILNPAIYGQEYYDMNLFTSDEFALKNKEAIRQFREATYKGWHYALKHKEEIANLILKKYNTQHKTKEALLFEANQLEQIILVNVSKIGDIDINRVKLIAENFIEAGYAKKDKLKDLDNFIFDTKIMTAEIKENHKTTLPFSKEEEDYLNHKASIKMCIDPDWEPYEKIDENGNHVGLGADFIKLIEKKIAKKITLIPTTSWVQSLQFVKEKKCEIISFLNQTPKRGRFLNFTPTLYEEPEVIVTNLSVPFIDGFESLNYKEVGIVKGYSTDEYIKKDYPNITIKYIKNSEEGFKMVSEGKLYATVNSLLGTANLIKKLNLVDIKISGKTNLLNKYRVGIVKDDLLLHSILSKAVLSISEEEKESIVNNWISVRFEQKVDYSILINILGVVFIFIAFLFYRHYTIQKINSQLEEKMLQQLATMQEKDNMLQQQARLAQMGEMINMIAHQWRQPIGAISSTVIAMDMNLKSKKFHLETNENKEEFKKYLESKFDKIFQYVQVLSTTIDDFRSFFKVDKEKMAVSLKEPIKMALNIVEPSMKDSHFINIVTQYRCDEKVLIYKNELMQVILNILKNSEDNFVEKNISSPSIHIVVEKKDGIHSIKIYDNGGGISEDIIDKLFEPYFTTKSDTDGTGIGMHMSKVIIEKHHQGKLLAYNYNDGVCFEIQLADTV